MSTPPRARLRDASNRWWRAVAGAALVLVVVSAGWQVTHRSHPESPAPPPPHQDVAAGTVLKARSLCATGATAPFAPTRITVDRVVRRAPVLALPRDANDVPGVPPLTEQGKHEFAWDRPPGVLPGSDRGNVLFNAHTWPWGTAPALGNLMLLHLRVGGRIVLFGAAGEHLCYTVTKQVEIRAEQTYPAYYDDQGPPQIAIMVCSGVRRGPGDWANRMVWFASPVRGAA